jgi:FlaA1/EpsC-like NDP-sugar epimerase
MINSFGVELLKLPRVAKQALIFILDVLICALSVWFTFVLRLDRWDLLAENLIVTLISSIILSSALFTYFGLYKSVFRYIGTGSIRKIINVLLIYFFIYFLIFSVISINDVPRGVGIIQPMLLFTGVIVSRILIGRWLNNINILLDEKELPRKQIRLLIYGAGLTGRKFLASLQSDKKYLVVGFIDDDPTFYKCTINGVYVYQSDSDISTLCLRLKVAEVFLAFAPNEKKSRNHAILKLENCRVRVRLVPHDFLVDSQGFLNKNNVTDLDVEDLLGRSSIPPDPILLNKNILNNTILVTGAGGSIGSELSKQIFNLSPKILILLDHNEHSLYLIYEQLRQMQREAKQMAIPLIDQNKEDFSLVRLVAVLGSVCDEPFLTALFNTYKPNVVFHAAAYKHVPLVENNLIEGVRNNVIGTLTCARVSRASEVESFTLISTDKAVRPTNIMGASKRIAELVIQSMAASEFIKPNRLRFSMVRFGNVLGSSGSVIPLFKKQINSGGPITLTHPEVTRYFMTIQEAVELVLQASSMANGGEVFILDMGEPIRIKDLAIKMIHLSGYLIKDERSPDGDIEIKVIGLRPGEKLYEELLIDGNPSSTRHPKIMMATEEMIKSQDLDIYLGRLLTALSLRDELLTLDLLKILVPGYHSIDDV